MPTFCPPYQPQPFTHRQLFQSYRCPEESLPDCHAPLRFLGVALTMSSKGPTPLSAFVFTCPCCALVVEARSGSEELEGFHLNHYPLDEAVWTGRNRPKYRRPEA